MSRRGIHVQTSVWRWGAMLLLAGAAAAWGESHVRFVVISYVSHGVQVRLPASPNSPEEPTRWTKAMLSAPIIEGEGIRTQAHGQAEVELECGSALRLTPGSELEFQRLSLSDDGVYRTTVAVHSGEAYFTMQDADSRDFLTRIGGAVLRMPNGGAKLRLDAPANAPASVEVLDGKVLVQDGGGQTLVASKNRFELLPEGKLQYTAMAAPDAWQKWSQQRDDAFQMAERRRGPQPPPGYTAADEQSAGLIPNQDPFSGQGWNLMSPIPMPRASAMPPRGGLRTGSVPAAPSCAHR